jgi:hypothetical protein
VPNSQFNSGINETDFDKAKAEVDKLTPMFMENPSVMAITCARYQLGHSVGMLAAMGHSKAEIMDMVIEAITSQQALKEYYDSEHPTHTGGGPG